MSTPTHTTSHNRDTVVATFHSHAEAQAAVRKLREAGFTDEQIGVISRDHDGSYATQAEGNMAEEGAMTGAATGLGAGALWGLGIAAGVLPAIGPVIAGGTLAAIAASAAGTAAAGGLVGSLIGLGIPEEEAAYYENEFNEGRTIVTVKAGKEKAAHVRSLLDGYNSYDYERRDQEFARNPKAKDRLDLNGKVVARAEVLDVDKSVETAGEVKVRKEVTSETKHVEVPVKREELVVERTKLDGEACDPISGKTEEERITLREEHVDVNKKTVAKEAVAVGKRTVEDTEHVSADLKKEKIVIDRELEKGRR